jgi:hypothetical protein
MLGENVTPTCVPITMVLELQINKKNKLTGVHCSDLNCTAPVKFKKDYSNNSMKV